MGLEKTLRDGWMRHRGDHKNILCYPVFVTDLVSDLKALDCGEVLVDDENLAKFSHDTSIFEVRPKAVVCIRNSSDVEKLVRFVLDNKKDNPGLSLTARAAGTDMTGGPLTESILLSATQNLNQLKEIGNDYVIVQPGLYYRDLEKALNPKNMWYPPYPASKELCAMGGVINNNSGGEKTLQYGKTKDYVLGLNMVLSDGKSYWVEKLDKNGLESKMKQKNFEGEVYSRIYKLLADNLQLIAKSKIDVTKNSSGYNIWDVIKPNGDFDLTQLLVGAQGTLGLMTEAKLKILPKEKAEKLFVVFFKDLSVLPQFTQEVLALKPTSLEITDDHTFKLYLKYAKDMAALLGANGIFAMFKLFLPEMLMVLTGGMPKLVLLAEFEGNEEEVLTKEVNQLAKIVQKYGLKGHLCKDAQEEAKYWRLRRDTFRLLREKIKGRYPTPYVDDLEIKASDLPEFWPKLTAILDSHKILYTISGHLGDGNLHIIPLMDIKQQSERDKIFEVMDQVYDLVLQYKGSLSGEHNDGLIRSPYLKKEYGEEVYEIFKKIKEIFDPQNIFNPHKKTDATMEWSKAHVRTQ